jgi:signal transduction histidine kinase
MERLVDGARAIGRGELSYRIPEDEGGEEIAVVAREFNGMAHNLERARAAVGREAEERVALERRLHEAEKMAAIGGLAAGLAHEIAAPLNVVSARAELLVRRDPGPNDRARSLQVIVQQIGRITTIVRNLLDFAGRREPRLRPVDLAELIDGALEFLELELSRAGVTVRREVSRPVPLRADPDLLHQLLVNLLLNAAQALEAGQGPRELVVRAAGGAQVVLEVQDSGPGIPPEALERLFDPFFTTKSRGTGLGLVVARNIAQEHGGALEARNREDGSGAVFRCVLPGLPAEA